MSIGSISGSMMQQQVQLTVLRKALDLAASNAESILQPAARSDIGQIVDTRV